DIVPTPSRRLGPNQTERSPGCYSPTAGRPPWTLPDLPKSLPPGQPRHPEKASLDADRSLRLCSSYKSVGVAGCVWKAQLAQANGLGSSDEPRLPSQRTLPIAEGCEKRRK